MKPDLRSGVFENGRWRPSFLLPLIAALAGLAAILVSIRQHGLWYDELFTLYVTRPGLYLEFALNEYWLQDNHPPLFYFLSWTTNFLGNSVELRRLINAAAFLAACGVFATIWRRRIIAPTTLTLFAFAMIAGHLFAGIAAELRSYFISLLLPGLLALLLLELARPLAEGGSQPARARPVISTFVVAALAMNLHFITTIVASSLFAAFFLRALLERNAFALRWTFASGAVALAPFLILTVLAFAKLEANTRSFWAEPGLVQGLRTLLETGLGSVPDILPLAIIALAGLLLIVLRIMRERVLRVSDRDLLTICAALVIFGIAVLAVHAIRPVIVGYYLVGAIGPATLACALAATGALGGLTRRGQIVGVGTVVIWSLGALFINTSHSLRWETSYHPNAQFVRDTLEACPQTLVHRDPYPHRDLTALPPEENRIVSLMSYGFLADLYGFELEPWESRAMAGTCPTLFWANYDNYRHPAGTVLKRLRRRGYPVTSLKRVQLGYGVVHVAPPTQVRQPNRR